MINPKITKPAWNPDKIMGVKIAYAYENGCKNTPVL
jgi:hypothetical protein